MKIDPKSIPRAARSCPEASKIDSKSIPRPSRDAPWCPRAFGRHPRSVLEASRGAPGTPRDRPEGPQERPGTPGGAPGSARECFGAAKIDAKSRPGAQKSIFSRAARSRSVVAAIFRRFLSIFGLFVKSANPPKYRTCRQNQGFGHSRYESRRSRNVTSKTIENRSQNRPKIVENRVSGPPGRPCRSTFAARSASVEQLGQLGAMRGGSDGPGARWGWLDEPYRWAKLDATAKLAQLASLVRQHRYRYIYIWGRSESQVLDFC